MIYSLIENQSHIPKQHPVASYLEEQGEFRFIVDNNSGLLFTTNLHCYYQNSGVVKSILGK